MNPGDSAESGQVLQQVWRLARPGLPLHLLRTEANNCCSNLHLGIVHSAPSYCEVVLMTFQASTARLFSCKDIRALCSPKIPTAGTARRLEVESLGG
jgi:hypothetical protein